MSRYRNSRIRVIRRLGQLPGFTKKITTRKKPNMIQNQVRVQNMQFD
jgi:hypothetical protein